MGDYFKPWQRKLSVVIVISACMLMVGWVRFFVVDNGPLKTEIPVSREHSRLPVEVHAIAGIGTDNHSLDSTELKVLPYQRDPLTGSWSFSVDGSPVQGKLKAYLDAAREKGNLIIMINHPDGESSKWAEIPMPLFLSLTDQSPAP